MFAMAIVRTRPGVLSCESLRGGSALRSRFPCRGEDRLEFVSGRGGDPVILSREVGRSSSPRVGGGTEVGRAFLFPTPFYPTAHAAEQ